MAGRPELGSRYDSRDKRGEGLNSDWWRGMRWATTVMKAAHGEAEQESQEGSLDAHVGPGVRPGQGLAESRECPISHGRNTFHY